MHKGKSAICTFDRAEASSPLPRWVPESNRLANAKYDQFPFRLRLIHVHDVRTTTSYWPLAEVCCTTGPLFPLPEVSEPPCSPSREIRNGLCSTPSADNRLLRWETSWTVPDKGDRCLGYGTKRATASFAWASATGRNQTVPNWFPGVRADSSGWPSPSRPKWTDFSELGTTRKR